MKRNRKDEGRREGKHVDFMNEGRKSEKQRIQYNRSFTSIKNNPEHNFYSRENNSNNITIQDYQRKYRYPSPDIASYNNNKDHKESLKKPYFNNNTEGYMHSSVINLKDYENNNNKNNKV